jgi:hypothetical protein
VTKPRQVTVRVAVLFPSSDSATTFVASATAVSVPLLHVKVCVHACPGASAGTVKVPIPATFTTDRPAGA